MIPIHTSGAGERFSIWCQLVNLVPTILEFWPNLALSLTSYMNLPQNLVPTSRYVGICSPVPEIYNSSKFLTVGNYSRVQGITLIAVMTRQKF